jgi:hypothetical protein
VITATIELMLFIIFEYIDEMFRIAKYTNIINKTEKGYWNLESKIHNEY